MPIVSRALKIWCGAGAMLVACAQVWAARVRAARGLLWGGVNGLGAGWAVGARAHRDRVGRWRARLGVCRIYEWYWCDLVRHGLFVRDEVN